MQKIFFTLILTWPFVASSLVNSPLGVWLNQCVWEAAYIRKMNCQGADVAHVELLFTFYCMSQLSEVFHGCGKVSSYVSQWCSHRNSRQFRRLLFHLSVIQLFVLTWAKQSSSSLSFWQRKCVVRWMGRWQVCDTTRTWKTWNNEDKFRRKEITSFTPLAGACRWVLERWGWKFKCK